MYFIVVPKFLIARVPKFLKTALSSAFDDTPCHYVSEPYCTETSRLREPEFRCSQPPLYTFGFGYSCSLYLSTFFT